MKALSVMLCAIFAGINLWIIATPNMHAGPLNYIGAAACCFSGLYVLVSGNVR